MLVVQHVVDDGFGVRPEVEPGLLQLVDELVQVKSRPAASSRRTSSAISGIVAGVLIAPTIPTRASPFPCALATVWAVFEKRGYAAPQ